MLDRLGYSVTAHNWQFRKPYADAPARFVKIDLQTTLPDLGQKVKTRKERRFGEGTRQAGLGMGTGIGALASPEAFALNGRAVPVPITCGDQAATIFVPHPYAWLNLRIRAAYDWLREQRREIPSTGNARTGDSKRLKHVYDVYVLIAMLTEEELHEAAALAGQYEHHSEAKKIRSEAGELYERSDALGVIATQNYARQLGANEIDYDLFREALTTSIGTG
jgi:hypothetical protein